MRKWMRERLQRRKKSSPTQPTESAPTPPPLQPAYFDADPANPAAPEPSRAAEPMPETPAETEPAPAEISVDAEASSAQPRPQESTERESASRESGQRGRGRRRRGGRGRGGRGGREAAVSKAFAPSGAKGSAPTELTDVAEEPSAEVDGESMPVAPVSESGAPTLVPAAAPRPPKGVVVLAIGLPGSGKSTWFKRHDVVPLSTDMLRMLLFDDVREQRFQDLVFSNLRSMLKARLIARRPMNYVDATNLTPQERHHWTKLAKDYGYEVRAIFFDVPLEVCLDRHNRRDRVVPEDVMRRMAAKLKPPSFDEGFSKITVVRVKKKAAGDQPEQIGSET